MVTAMDKMWSGQGAEGDGQAASAAGMTAAMAQQQAARLQAALDSNDGDDVYVQVRQRHNVLCLGQPHAV
jgi:hypothetical protein